MFAIFGLITLAALGLSVLVSDGEPNSPEDDAGDLDVDSDESGDEISAIPDGSDVPQVVFPSHGQAIWTNANFQAIDADDILRAVQQYLPVVAYGILTLRPDEN